MIKLKRLKDKYIKLYSLKSNNKTILQIEDMGDYIRIYNINHPCYRCDEELITIDLKRKK